MASVNTGLISQVSWVSPLHSSSWEEGQSDKKWNYKLCSFNCCTHPCNRFHSLFLNVADHGQHSGRKSKHQRTLFSQNFLGARQRNESTYVSDRVQAEANLPDCGGNGSTQTAFVRAHSVLETHVHAWTSSKNMSK